MLVAAVASGSSCPTEYDCDRYVLGVGWRGMAKGICELAWSFEAGDVCDMPSPGKSGLPGPPGGMADVGEGKTSDSLEGGSFRSLFQMPVLHAKVPEPPWDRPRTAEEAECDPQGPGTDSAEGVLGCDVVGDMELLANEPFLGWGGTGADEVSFNHEARRTGFWSWTECDKGSWRWGSASSSELAKASESGVDRRLSLSSNMA